MSQSIIDSLVIAVGLDAKGYNAGTKKVTEDLDKLKKNATKTTKEFESQGKKAGSYFSEMRQEAGKLLAMFVGGAGIAGFLTNLTNSNNQLGLLSKNIGISATELVAWSNASEQMGGSAEGMKNALYALKQTQEGMKYGIKPTGLLGMSLLNMNPTDDPLKMIDSAMARLDELKSQGMSEPDRYSLLKQAGIGDEGLINLMLKGTRAAKEQIEAQKLLAEKTAKNTDIAAKFKAITEQIGFEIKGFANDIYNKVVPSLEEWWKELKEVYINLTDNGNWFKDNKDLIFTFFTGLALVAVPMLTKALWGLVAPIAPILLLIAALSILWEDYKGWKAGSKSLIDYEEWKPGILSAIDGIARIRDMIKSAVEWIEKLTGHKISDALTGWIPGTKDINEFLDFITPSESGNPREVGGKITASHAQRFFENMGWTPEQSAGLAAQIMAESKGKSNAIGDSGLAHGLIQWHPDREKEFKNLPSNPTHKGLLEATPNEQLAFMHYELTSGNEQSAGRKIKAARTASQAGSIASKEYIRPLRREAEAEFRGKLAQELHTKLIEKPEKDKPYQYKANDPLLAFRNTVYRALTNNKTSPRISNAETNINQINVYANTNNDARIIGSGIEQAIQNNRLAAQANTGLD